MINSLFNIKANKTILYATAIALSTILYFIIAYVINRSDFVLFFGVFTFLFLLYLGIVRTVKQGVSSKTPQPKTIYLFILVGIIFRLLLIPVEPNLTDDYFRFYWDGLLSVHHISPYAYLPIELMENGLAYRFELTENLFNQLNSPKYYSVYPPVLQWLFMAAAYMAGPSNILGFVIILKIFIVCFEIGSIALILKILPLVKKPLYAVLWYVLNPLVIIELTGNIHFEAAMIFFVLLAFYLLYTQKTWLYAALAFTGGVASKLLPLIFMPFFIKRIGFKKTMIFGLCMGFFLLILTFRFIDPPIVQNILNSVGLYYNTFEFNASFYYIFRWIGYQIKGWNMIATIGKLTALGTFATIVLCALFEHKRSLSSLLKFSMFALTLYLLLANIVHPWYVVPLVAFAALNGYKYPILWTWLIGLSYFAYSNAAYEESLILIAIEYIMVLSMMGYELVKKPIQYNYN